MTWEASWAYSREISRRDDLILGDKLEIILVNSNELESLLERIIIQI
jgi:hypothetical protein